MQYERDNLQTKLVEEVVDEVFETGQNVVVQMLACHTLEYNPAV